MNKFFKKELYKVVPYTIFPGRDEFAFEIYNDVIIPLRMYFGINYEDKLCMRPLYSFFDIELSNRQRINIWIHSYNE